MILSLILTLTLILTPNLKHKWVGLALTIKRLLAIAMKRSLAMAIQVHQSLARINLARMDLVLASTIHMNIIQM